MWTTYNATANRLVAHVCDVGGTVHHLPLVPLATLNDYATTASVGTVDTRLRGVEAAYAQATALSNLQSLVSTTSGRVTAIESAYAPTTLLTSLYVLTAELDRRLAGVTTNETVANVTTQLALLRGSNSAANVVLGAYAPPGTLSNAVCLSNASGALLLGRWVGSTRSGRWAIDTSTSDADVSDGLRPWSRRRLAAAGPGPSRCRTPCGARTIRRTDGWWRTCATRAGPCTTCRSCPSAC